MFLIEFVLVTALLALAIKQLSYALYSGSVFEPLRSEVGRRMHRGDFGFNTLNQLLTCKLCVSMQMSLWFVTLPMLVIGLRTDALHFLFSGIALPVDTVVMIVLGSFLYGMAISGMGLGLWIFLEYPAKRFEETALRLHVAQQTIADLEALLEASGKEVSHMLPVGDILLPDDFRALMESLEDRCWGIGCGYSRRYCRTERVSEWLETWSAGNSLRTRLVPRLRKKLTEVLPEHFRKHSKKNEATGNTKVFRKLYQEVASVLAD